MRHTRWDSGGLIVREKDENESIYVLVTGTNPTYVVRGWSFGYKVKVEKYFHQKNLEYPFWIMPQKELELISTLARILGVGGRKVR